MAIGCPNHRRRCRRLCLGELGNRHRFMRCEKAVFTSARTSRQRTALPGYQLCELYSFCGYLAISGITGITAMSTRHVLVTATQLGATLQAARKAKGLTQAALAGRLGLSQSRVSHLELNVHALSVEQLLAWCAALGLELTIGTRDDSTAATKQVEW